MKHYYLLASLSILLLLGTSCSNDMVDLSTYPSKEIRDSKNDTNSFVKQQDTYHTILSYLELKDNQYILHLSKEHARLAGIPEKEYEAVVKDIQETNEMIKTNMQKDPDGIINLADPQNLPAPTSFDIQILASMPGGTINTDGQEEQKSNLFAAPHEANYVRFNIIRTPAP